MPNTKFIVNHKVAESFRINKVKGMFDCQFNEVKKEYDVNIPIEDMNWNVGLIVGASGTGKTTIAKNAFKVPLIEISFNGIPLYQSFIVYSYLRFST